MLRKKHEHDLQIYIDVLKDALEKDEDKTNNKRYEGHYAQALRMLGLLRAGEHERFEYVRKEEIKSYGRDFIQGEIGAAVEVAWNQFCSSSK